MEIQVGVQQLRGVKGKNPHSMGLQKIPEPPRSGKATEMVINEINSNSFFTSPGQEFRASPTGLIIPEDVEFHANQLLGLFHRLEYFLKSQVSIFQYLDGISRIKGTFPDFLESLPESGYFHLFPLAWGKEDPWACPTSAGCKNDFGKNNG